MNYIYIRVSTDKQGFDRQIHNFNEKGYDLTPMYDSTGALLEIKSGRNDVLVFSEKYTGTTLSNRKELKSLLKKLEEEDILIVDSLSRLARSMKSLIEIIEIVSKHKAGFISLKEDLDLSTATGKLMFNLIGAINQFERDITSERTKETLQAMKDNGYQLGRKRIHDHEEVVKLYIENEDLSMRAVANVLGLNVSQVSRILKKYKVDPKKRIIMTDQE